nr:hypothetical protein [Tanacetum cinerariifolium]
MAQTPVRNHAQRGNRQQYARMTLPNPQRHVVPITVLTKSTLVPITAAIPVTAVVLKPHVTRPRQAKIVGNPQHALKDKGVIDSGCSRHMTGNMSYLSNFEELNGGYVAFGGNPKGGKISGKEENQMLLRVPKENNMYDVDLKNIVLSGDLNCLFAKATLDESNLWHRRFLRKFDAEKAGEESDQQYVLFPVWSFGSTNPHNTDGDDVFDEKEPELDAKKPKFEVKKPESAVRVSPSSSAKTKKHDDKTKREAEGKSRVELSTWFRNLSEEFENFTDNSINEVNAASTLVPAVGQILTNSTNTFSDASPSNTAVTLEDITYSDDEEDVGAEADFSNLETNIIVSPILTTRVYKDHHVTQIIGDLSSAPQTRSMTRMVKEQGGSTQINNDDFHTCMFACFLLQEEPKRVYVDDIIFGSTNKDLCKAFEKLMKDKFQMSSMGELTFFLCLQVKQKPARIFISQDKYVAKVLRKFGLTDRKSASTPIDTEKPLLKDPDGEDVDVHTYRSMIGSLMYLTSSRPDIMFATVVATFSTEAEYVDDASCCAQVLWIQNQLLDYGDFLLFEEADAFLSLEDDPDLPKINPFYYDPEGDILLLEAILNSEPLPPLPNHEQYLPSYKKELKASSSIGDADSIDCLPNEEIFVELTRMGYEKPSTKLIFYKAFFSAQWKVGKGISEVDTPLFDGILVPQQVQDDVVDAAKDEDAANEIFVEPTPPSPTPAEPLPQQELIHSSSQVKSTPPSSPHQSPIAQPSSPSPQQRPSHDAEISMTLLNTLLETCATLTMQIENLEKDKETNEAEPAEVEEVSAPRRRRGVIIQDPEEATTASLSVQSEVKSKDKEKGEKEIEEENGKRKSESSNQKAAKKKKIDEEVHVVDYQIHAEHNKPFYKIIRAYGSYQLFLSFISMLRNFDREDLVMLWKIIQERFESSEPKNFSDNFLLNDFKTMFEKPNVEDNIWKNQRGIYGLAKVKSWKLLESYGVHIITFTTTQMILLVDRRYPLIRFTLEQMLNNVRLEVKEESEVSLELLRFVRRQQQQGF